MTIGGSTGTIAATATIDIYHTTYGRFDFVLTNDSASTSPITQAVLTVDGTEFDALDTGGFLEVTPSSLSSNNSVTSDTATVTFTGGLAAGESANGDAGDFDPYVSPTTLSMVVTFANGGTLSGNFVQNGFIWTWDESETGPPAQPVTIEAESMTLNGYSVENGNRIKLTSSCCQGTASVSFPGNSGVYDFTFYGVSESDGPSSIVLKHNGTTIHNYTFGVQPAASEFTLTNLTVTNGDLFEIVGTFASGAFARVDKIAFTPSQ